MSERKFKFVSPGIFLKEIDQSSVPAEPIEVGPIIIGRSERGPAMRPVSVDSFSEFVNTFGQPFNQESVPDAWRDGSKAGTTYGAYAAKAWLASQDRVTFVRLLGKENSAADTNGQAGWKVSGDAYGMWLFGSGSQGAHTGCLAAIWYTNNSTSTNLAISGTIFGQPLANTSATGSNAVGVIPISDGSPSNAEFKIVVTGDKARSSDASTTNSYLFNFNPHSNKFIRNVFNTNPTLCGPLMASGDKEKYFLGETFENRINDTGLVAAASGGTPANVFGVMMKMQAAANTAVPGDVFQQGSTKAQTNWIIGQDMNANSASFNPQNSNKLFKLISRDSGEWMQNNLKVAFTNIRYGSISGSYGTFDVVLRRLSDTDPVIETVERFSNCSLDPTSVNYISRKMGDKYVSYDATSQRNTDIGQYDNKSKYVYVSVDDSVENGTADSELLPFGALGPIQYTKALLKSGSTAFTYTNGGTWTASTGPMIQGGGNAARVPLTYKTASSEILYVPSGSGNSIYTFNFPTTDLRVSGTDGGILDPKNAYWGAYTGQSTGNEVFAKDNRDLVRVRPSALNSTSAATGYTENAYNFSLDDLSASFTGSGGTRLLTTQYYAGNRVSGTSITALNASGYKKVIDLGLAKFVTVFAGGSDGVEIKEKEPFRSALAAGKTETNSYVYETYKRAIDVCKDPEVVSFNIATVPSLTAPGLTKRLLEHCENRGDALCIMDLENGFVPPPERGSDSDATSVTIRGQSETTISALRDRQLNSSFGCAYYPWVQALDDDTNKVVYLPPSVVALGAMSFTDDQKGPWFAPAGFTRGGLSTGVAGIPVLSATSRLTSDQRDDLYENNINPLASFPNEGVVIFGQKTLQVKRTALDRINVRRMLIYVKRNIAQIAANVLFEPNVQDTWDRFLAKANPMLIDVQQRFGIQEYKLVLDDTTTTPDLIDQNIMYAKLFIKPTRAIEFIAVDFFITNTGASFED